MRRLLGFLIIPMLAIGGNLIVSPAGALGAPTSTTESPDRKYATGAPDDGLNPGQCLLPVEKRQGPWLCTQPRDPSSGDRALQSGVCSVIGCWYYIDNFWAEFEGGGIYGYGGTELGTIVFYVEIKFSGGRSASRPFQLESSRGTAQVVASGERLYFSEAHPEGNPVSDGATYQTWSGGPYAAEILVNAFGTTGYTAFEDSVAHAGLAHQFEWTDPSSAYPGTWWVWFKSPKFHRNDSGSYILSNPPELGLEPDGSGWTP